MILNVLTIAVTDPSGGAVIQADRKAFSALGAFGTSVVTALVAQNTRGVDAVHEVPAAFVDPQMHTLFADVRIDAVKIGMLGTAELVHTVAAGLRRFAPAYVVLVAVVVAKSGHRLLAPESVAARREELLPQVDLITPNLPEAADLLGEDEAVDEEAMLGQLERLAEWRLGVLLKGGDMWAVRTAPTCCASTVAAPGCRPPGGRPPAHTAPAARCRRRSRRCARTAGGWTGAVTDAMDYLTRALAAADRLDVGGGHRPQHHFYA